MLEFLKKLLGLGENLTDPKQSDIKKEKWYKYRIEAAIEYIFVDERAGQYKGISKKKQDQLKLHFRKRVFDIA